MRRLQPPFLHRIGQMQHDPVPLVPTGWPTIMQPPNRRLVVPSILPNLIQQYFLQKIRVPATRQGSQQPAAAKTLRFQLPEVISSKPQSVRCAMGVDARLDPPHE